MNTFFVVIGVIAIVGILLYHFGIHIAFKGVLRKKKS